MSIKREGVRGPTVLLEGMDLSGKSSAFEGLKDYLSCSGISYRESRNSLIPDSDNPPAMAAHFLRKDPDVNRWETGALFFRSHLHEVERYTPPPPGQLHLQDSCFLRTISYNDVLGTPFGDKSMCDAMYERVVPKRPEFDVVIFLTASIAKRGERLKLRQQECPSSCDLDDAKVESDATTFETMNSRLLEVTNELYPCVEVIDTTELQKKEVLDHILNVLARVGILSPSSNLEELPVVSMTPTLPRTPLPVESALQTIDAALAGSSCALSEKLLEKVPATQPLLASSSACSNHVKLIVIGLGPHAQRIYLPFLMKAQNVSIVLVVDLKSQQTTIKSFLRRKGLQDQLPILYVDPLEPDADVLPVDLQYRLNEVVAEQGVDGVLITTEPTAHTCYGKWAACQRLHILMDKPISARINSACDLAQSVGLCHDYEALLHAWEDARDERKRDTLFSVNVQRRYHPGFLRVLELVREVSCEHQQAVTYCESFHSDGQLRLPGEIKDLVYHGYNKGHGKVSHSGYHFLDFQAQVHEAGHTGLHRNSANSLKKADAVEVVSSFVSPAGFMLQRNEGDFSRDFGEEDYKQYCPCSHADLLDEFTRGNYGELDATIQLTFLQGNTSVALGNIALLHNSFSRRSWMVPSKDLYKGNGRVKHEHHIIQQGPYQAIHVHSYQSFDKHDGELKTPEGISNSDEGGHDHFDITVWRNTELFADKNQRSYYRFRPGLEKGEAFQLRGEQAKSVVIEEFLAYIRGDIELKEVVSHLPSHRLSMQLMSAAYQSHVLRSGGQDPCVRIGLSPMAATVCSTPNMHLCIGSTDDVQSSSVETTDRLDIGSDSVAPSKGSSNSSDHSRLIPDSRSGSISRSQFATGTRELAASNIVLTRETQCEQKTSARSTTYFSDAVMALAQGFLDGGARYCINYPGFKSHEVAAALSFLANSSSSPPLEADDGSTGDEDGKATDFVFAGMALNEKVAYEMAFGASLAGLRALVTMKNYGLNVAADPFLNSLLTGVNAGLVMCVTDDMVVSGSQGQLDSRSFREFYGGLWLEPASLQDAYTFVSKAFELSEQLDIPVVLRLTNSFFRVVGPLKVSHPPLTPSRKLSLTSSSSHQRFTPEEHINKFVVHPSTWRRQSANLVRKNEAIQSWVDKGFESSHITAECETFHQQQHQEQHQEQQYRCGCLVLVCGACSSEDIDKALREAPGACPKAGSSEPCIATLLRVVTYPLPAQCVALAAESHRVAIVDHTNYVRNLLLQQMQQTTSGRMLLTYKPHLPDYSSSFIVWDGLSNLFSALGGICPYGGVVGDIGRTTREDTGTVRTVLCLGSAISVAMGMCSAIERDINTVDATADGDYIFCVTGDGGFLHGGGSALLMEARARDARMCVVIIDNGGSMSTGGQMVPSGLLMHLQSLSSIVTIIKIDYIHISKDELVTKLCEIKQCGKLAVIHLVV